MVDINELEIKIKKYCDEHINNNPGKTINASISPINQEYSCNQIEIVINEFSNDDLIKTLKIIQENYNRTQIEEINEFYNSGIINLENYVIEDNKEETNRLKNKTYISIILDKNIFNEPLKENKIKIKRFDEEFQDNDLNCLMKLWKAFALKTDTSNNESLKEKIENAGATVYEPKSDYSWDDLAGYEDIKEDIKRNIILPFKNPDIYKAITEFTRTKINSNMPRGILLVGKPGTGKTTSAKIIANENNIPLIYMPVEKIMSKWYGEAENRLSNIFKLSNEYEKSILYIDEIDSLAGSREQNMHEATRKILSVLLRKMESMDTAENVLTLGSTNDPKSLDPALMSRFSKKIYFRLPNPEERKKIFGYYAKQFKDSELYRLAHVNNELSGRDIENICSEAERIHAQNIIENNLTPCAPEIETYFKAIGDFNLNIF